MFDISPNFYQTHAQRYAEINKLGLQRMFLDTTNPDLKGNHSLLDHLKTLIPGTTGLDAGCGAGAIDVADMLADGYDIWGIDVVPENIQAGVDHHPNLKDRIKTADLAKSLFFPQKTFDFVLCNAVIQHIKPNIVYDTTLPELARILKTDGVLQLMFKIGNGITNVFDEDYGVFRAFQLFQEFKILEILNKQGMELIESGNGDGLGGMMYFTNPKADRYCVFYTRKN